MNFFPIRRCAVKGAFNGIVLAVDFVGRLADVKNFFKKNI